jgi:hypothetical protein
MLYKIAAGRRVGQILIERIVRCAVKKTRRACVLRNSNKRSNQPGHAIAFNSNRSIINFSAKDLRASCLRYEDTFKDSCPIALVTSQGRRNLNIDRISN